MTLFQPHQMWASVWEPCTLDTKKVPMVEVITSLWPAGMGASTTFLIAQANQNFFQNIPSLPKESKNSPFIGQRKSQLHPQLAGLVHPSLWTTKTGVLSGSLFFFIVTGIGICQQYLPRGTTHLACTLATQRARPDCYAGRQTS